MRWGSGVESLQEVGEQGDVLLEDGLQNVPLLGGVVNANGASTNLTAIQNQVIMLPTHLVRLRVQEMGVLWERSGEGVVGRLQLIWAVLFGKEQWEVHHPQETEVRGVAQWDAAVLQLVGTLQSQLAQERALKM